MNPPTILISLASSGWKSLLQSASFACVVVSHDRYFLENVATEMVELNRAYPDGLLRVAGNYSTFLEEKEAFLQAQAKHQDALENRVHREIEWLRRGPKARTGKSKARIDRANQLIGELADLNSANSHRQRSHRFLCHRPQDQAPDRTGECLVRNRRTHAIRESGFHLDCRHARRTGGTERQRQDDFAAALRGELAPTTGEIRTRANRLRIVYFDQNRSA